MNIAHFIGHARTVLTEIDLSGVCLNMCFLRIRVLRFHLKNDASLFGCSEVDFASFQQWSTFLFSLLCSPVIFKSASMAGLSWCTKAWTCSSRKPVYARGMECSRAS